MKKTWVYVTANEINNIIHHAKYVKKDPILIEKAKYVYISAEPQGNGYYKLQRPCPFYDKESHSCLVYEVRPRVCRIYPFRIVRLNAETMPFVVHLHGIGDCQLATKIRKYIDKNIDDIISYINELASKLLGRDLVQRIKEYTHRLYEQNPLKAREHSQLVKQRLIETVDIIDRYVGLEALQEDNETKITIMTPFEFWALAIKLLKEYKKRH